MRAINPQREIAIIWSINDVKGVCPELSDEQAMQVLQQVQSRHDPIIGVNWEVLDVIASELFPLAVSDDDDIPF